MIGYTVGARDRKPKPMTDNDLPAQSVKRAFSHKGMLTDLMARLPELQTRRFRLNLVKAFSGEPGVLRIVNRLWCVPDAHAIRAAEREVDVYEVIVWHGLDAAKTNEYGDLKRGLAANGITLRVFVAAWGQVTELDLTPL
jgi:hypothetical protein